MKKIIPYIVVIAITAGVAYMGVKQMMTIDRTVIKMKIAEDITVEDAIESMKLRANVLNMKLVAELPLSKQIESMGVETSRMEIYQFCNPLTAKKMVDYDINFAAYLPCRIAVVEDADGVNWLVMMDLDLILQMTELSPELEKEAISVRDGLNEIMRAGANGEL